MKQSSSYIFFRNPYNEERKREAKEKDVVYLDLDSVNSRFVKMFDLDCGDPLLSVYKHSYSFIKDKCNVEITINDVAASTYVNISAEGKNKSSIVKCLENIQNTIKKSNIEDRYIMIISYDYVSEYYCNLMYPKLNTLERNLRRLMFNAYTLQFGAEYYKPTIPASIQNNREGILKDFDKNENKDVRRIKYFFYTLEYNHIQDILFTARWTELDKSLRHKFLTENPNLTELSNQKLRDAFVEFTPKSDWERLFSKKTSGKIDVSKLLDDIRKSRNKVAHCKFFDKSEYKTCCQKISELNTEIISAIEITETRDFSDKNAENLRLSAQRVMSVFVELEKQIAPMIQTMAQSAAVALDAFSENIISIMKEYPYSISAITGGFDTDMKENEQKGED